MTTAQEARNEAIRTVERNAKREWLDGAFDALKRAAAKHNELTTDEVWDEYPAGCRPAQHENRAMGPVMARGKREGLIRLTSMFRDSNRGHARALRVWESTVAA